MSANGDKTPPASTGEQTPPPAATLANRPKRIKYKEQPFPQDDPTDLTNAEDQSEMHSSVESTPQIIITEPKMAKDQRETLPLVDDAIPSPAHFPKLEAIPEKA